MRHHLGDADEAREADADAARDERRELCRVAREAMDDRAVWRQPARLREGRV